MMAKPIKTSVIAKTLKRCLRGDAELCATCPFVDERDGYCEFNIRMLAAMRLDDQDRLIKTQQTQLALYEQANREQAEQIKLLKETVFGGARNDNG